MSIGSVARLVRLPNLLAIIVFQTLLQYGLIVPRLEAMGAEGWLRGPLFAMLVAATVLIAAGGNAINDYFDIAADRVNRPGRVVVGGAVDRRSALLVHVVLSLLGVFAGIYVSFVLRRAAFMLLFVSVPVLLWFYSTHFKRQILVGNILVALLVALTGYVVVSADYAALDRQPGGPDTGGGDLSTLWYEVCAYCIFAFLSNLGREVIKDMEDADGDRSSGCHTLAVELGCPYAKAVALLIELFMCAMLAVVVARMGLCPLSAYVALALIAPSVALCIMVWRAAAPAAFHAASVVSKLIMMAGVASILLL